jgi:sugar transferase (PEP-CTERM/EpsH1 system associated)
MSRLLMLAHRLPFPPNKGDKIRAYNVLAHLSRRHDVRLACLIDDASDVVHIDALKRCASEVAYHRIDGRARRLGSLRALWPARSITVTHFYSAALQERIDRWIDEQAFDGIYCSSAPMAEYLFRSRHRDGRLREAVRAMDLIDVDSVKWAQYAQAAPPWMAWLYRHEAEQLGAYERKIVEAFDRVFLVSAAEAGLLAPGGGAGRVESFSNGVDLEYFSPREGREPGAPLIVFTGVMDYPPNEAAVDWFAHRVMPIVREQVPAATFAIVGSRPTRPVRRLAALPGVVVTGFVADVRDWLARAHVCVAPLQIARGVQNKVLEAMAMGRSVVVTPEAFEGIDATPDRELLIAGDAQGFAQSVLGLLRDPDRSNAIGAAARACVERRYRWDTNLAVLDEVFP